MSILTHRADPREATNAETEALALACVSPHCEAAAHPDMRIPLCGDCARDVAIQYMAATHRAEPTEPIVTEAQARTRRSPDGLVYFIRLGDLVKIGFTTNLKSRMQALPHEEILATQPGTMKDEARCHAAFAHHRVTGEWFRMGDDLMAFIADIQAQAA